MAKSDGANTPTGHERSFFMLLREAGDALEDASPPFDAAASAARLRKAAWTYGLLLRPGDIPEKDLAIPGANLEEEAPPFDVEAGAARLREAAHARGFLSGSASEAFGEAASRALAHNREVVSHGDAQAQEVQLLAQIADGNIEEPLTELYRRYHKNLYRFGFQMLDGDERLAEEMVQETFLRLWRSAGGYEPERGSVTAYLFVIARSAAADIRKRTSSRPLLSGEDFQLPPLPDSADQILDSLMVREALDKLSLQVLRLTLEGLTPSQIAERLNLPLEPIKTRMSYGIRALRAAETA